MKHLYALFIFILIIQTTHGQQAPKNLVTALKLDSTMLRLGRIEADFKRLRQINDSITKELYVYKSKDDIVLNRLNQVEAHSDALFGGLMTFFTFLVAFFVAVGAYVGWQFYNNDLEVIRKNLKESNSKLSDLIDTTKINIDSAVYELFKELTLITSGSSDHTRGAFHNFIKTEERFYRNLIAIRFSLKAFEVSNESNKVEAKRLVSIHVRNTQSSAEIVIKSFNESSLQKRKQLKLYLEDKVFGKFTTELTEAYKIESALISNYGWKLQKSIHELKELSDSVDGDQENQ